jgi:hypothetical protein
VSLYLFFSLLTWKLLSFERKYGGFFGWPNKHYVKISCFDWNLTIFTLNANMVGHINTSMLIYLSERKYGGFLQFLFELLNSLKSHLDFTFGCLIGENLKTERDIKG